MKRKTIQITMMIGAMLAGMPAVMLHAAENVDLRRGFSGVASLATPAVVFIQVEKEIPAGNSRLFFNNPFDLFGEEFGERFFGMPQNRNPRGRRFPQRKQRMFKQEGQGSGFLISKDGYILTNTHVVGDVDKITVKLASGEEYTAKRIGADPKTEVALIKIDAKKDLPFLKAGNPEKLLTGEWVIAIGNPFGLKETLTVGVVSAKGRTNMGITDYEDFIQTDAAINPGNSGGPLLNIDAEVIGINTAIYSRNGGNMGIGFAVPIDMAMRVKDQLLTNGKVTRGYVGVMLNPGELTEEMAGSFGRKDAGGVLIAEVLKDGPADKAGIREGDILTELNGQKIAGNTQFRNNVAQIMPNTKVTITLYRDGKEMKRALTVGTFPDDDAPVVTEGAGSAASKLEKMGFDVQNLTENLAEQLGFEEKSGVVIAEVFPGSAAENAGLKAGMLVLQVNRHPVKNEKEFEKELKQAKGNSILFRIKTDQGTFFVTLPINK